MDHRPALNPLSHTGQDKINLEELEKNNAHSTQAIRDSPLTSSILFQNSGLTNGILEEKDTPEEFPKQKARKQEEKEDYEDINNDQESVEEADKKSSDTFPAKEACEALPEESQADEQSECLKRKMMLTTSVHTMYDITLSS